MPAIWYPKSMQELLPPETAEGAGFDSPRVRQFTVFLENKVGRLHTLMRALEQGSGRLAALSIEESGDSALVRIICGHPEFGRELLQTGGFPFSETELLVVELPKRVKAPLMTLCAALLAAELNIHYAYPLLRRPHGNAAMAIHVDDLTVAADILIKKRFTLISEKDLGK